MNEGKYFINNILLFKILCIFTSLNFLIRAHRPTFTGLFLCLQDKGGGALRATKSRSSDEEFSSVNTIALFIGANLNTIVMLNDSSSATGTSIGVLTPEELIKDLIISDPVRQLIRIGIYVKPFKYSPNE